jgi:aspartyl-tRNA(Asn)/glutamyl-tRNA(Gln) amidotransferase subunit C
MKITREEVKRVAMLARLSLTAEEEERLTEQLDKILLYMEKLNELDTEGVEPLANVIDIVNAFREDRLGQRFDTETLMANAPARKDNFLKVPKIIE